MTVNLLKPLNLLVLTFFLFFSISTYAQGKLGAQSTISGIVSNANDDEITLHFITDVVTGGRETLLVPVNINNAFSVDFTLTAPVECILVYQNILHHFYIKPDDQIIFKLDALQPNAVKLFGTAANDNKALYHFRSKLKQDLDYSTSDDLFELKKMVLIKQADLLNELDQYPLALSKESRDLIQTDILYGMHNFLLAQGLKNGFKYTKEQLFSDFFTFLQEEEEESSSSLIYSAYYRAYIENYLTFKETYPDFKFFQYIEKTYVVKSTSKYLYYAPGMDSTLFKLSYDDTLKFHGNEFVNEENNSYDRSASLQNYKWYEVDIYGTKGWVSATDILEVGGTGLIEIIKKPKLVRRVVLEAEVLYNNLPFMAKPTEDAVVKTLYKGEKLDFLNVKTNEKYKYEINGALYNDYFYKLKTKSGEDGWLPSMAYHRYEKEILMTNTMTKVKSIDYLQKYVDGIGLYYLSALELINNFKEESKESIRAEINNFYALNECKLLKNSIVSNIPTSYINSLSDNESAPLEVFEPVIANRRILSSSTSLTPDLFEKIELEVHSIGEIQSLFGPDKNNEDIYNRLLASYVDKIEFDFVKLKGKKYKQPHQNFADQIVSLNIDFALQPIEGILSRIHIENALSIDNLFEPNDIFGYSTTNYNLREFIKQQRDLVFQLDSPKLIKFYKGSKEHHIFVEPGDEINYDAAQHAFFNISNDNNTIIDKVYAVLDSFNAHKGLTTLTTLQDAYAQAKADMDQVIYSMTVSTGFELFAQKSLLYGYGLKLLALDEDKTLIQSQLTEINVDAQGIKYLSVFHNFLMEYVSFQSSLIENMNENEYAESQLNNETYSFYQAYTLFTNVLENSISFDKTQLLDFLSIEEHAEYKRVLKYAYNQYGGIPYGHSVPNFQLEDIDGQPVSLDQYNGKIVYIDFWASWCPPCTKSIKSLQPVIKANPNVVFLFVNLDRNKRTYLSYLYNHNLQGVYLYGEAQKEGQSAVSDAYGVTHLPKTYIIDREGHVIYNSSNIKTGLTIENLLKAVE